MLTHIDKNNRPTMVDVTGKDLSLRMARAQSVVVLPEIFRDYFVADELVLKKGPVFQTAIIAGTMAVKKTHELIPFCHQLPIESIKFTITVKDLEVNITCEVKTTYKTGVEMEALHGASVAALTIYDMCKALSHEIILKETKLLAKTGGKRTILSRPTYGLILTGGKSARMGQDKALINYHGKPHALYMREILESYCEQVYFSSKSNQWSGTPLENYPSITDQFDGPIGGILSAFHAFPEVNWVVLACDLVHFNHLTVETLLASAELKDATCFKNKTQGFPEALCALYTPSMNKVFLKAYEQDIKCPVKVLRDLDITLLDQAEGINLANINTPEERHEIH